MLPPVSSAWLPSQAQPSPSHAEVTRRSRAGITPGLIPEYRALPCAFWPEERCSISHTAAEYKQDILSPFQSMLQCEQPSWGWDVSEAGSRVTEPRSFWVQGSFLTLGPLQGTSASGCSILCQSGQRDLWQHLMLKLNLHTLLGLGAERLHVNRPEASTQCQQKLRHLSQQKTKDQGMWPLKVNWPQLHVYVCVGERFVTYL